MTAEYEITQEKVDKINELLNHGLTKGLGNPNPGEMCVEAAVCYAFGLKHGDDPICVGSAVRQFKIALNDARWSSNQSRAEGMRKLAIAQLGSDTLNQVEFSKRLALKTVQILLSSFLKERGFYKEAKACEDSKDLKQAAAAAYAARYAARYAADADARYAADAARYAADAAYDADADARYAARYAAAAYAAAAAARYAADADAAAAAARYAAAADARYAAARYAAAADARYDADARYAADAARYAADAAYAADAVKYLIMSADIALEILKEMNSPGCVFLKGSL